MMAHDNGHNALVNLKVDNGYCFAIVNNNSNSSQSLIFDVQQWTTRVNSQPWLLMLNPGF